MRDLNHFRTQSFQNSNKAMAHGYVSGWCKGIRPSTQRKHYIRLNSSITYNFNADKSDFLMMRFLQNILDIHDNKRYVYSIGSSQYYPDRAKFTEEPFAASFQFSMNY